MPTAAIGSPCLIPATSSTKKASAFSKDKNLQFILTSEMVLAEFLNSFSGVGPHLRRVAARAVAGLRASPQIVVISQTSLLFQRALRRFEDMADKSWSLTDCASFVIMEDEGITAALTHDRHFIQAGFRALLR